MSPDLKHATVLVMPLGGAKIAKTLEALNRSRGRIKGVLGRRLHLRFVPDLRFVVDTRYEDDMRVASLLKETQAGEGETSGD